MDTGRRETAGPDQNDAAQVPPAAAVPSPVVAFVSGLGNRRSGAVLARSPVQQLQMGDQGTVTVADYTPINNPDGYGLNVKIQFKPSANMRKLADEIAFIQTVRRSSGGRPAGQADPQHPDAAGRMTRAGSYVDATTDPVQSKDNPDRSGFYGYNGQSGKSGRIVTPWTSAAPDQTAELRDTPGGSTFDGAAEFHAETAVVVKAGQLAGKTIAVVNWGYKADAQGKVTPIPVSFSAKASDDFREALGNWNRQARERGEANRRNPKGPQFEQDEFSTAFMDRD